MKAIRVIAWLFLAWALMAGTREGEQAYAIAFSLVAAVFVAGGGSVLAFSSRRGLRLGIGCATLVLGLPLLIALAIWVRNLI